MSAVLAQHGRVKFGTAQGILYASHSCGRGHYYNPTLARLKAVVRMSYVMMGDEEFKGE
jgi:hypothetical protein